MMETKLFIAGIILYLVSLLMHRLKKNRKEGFTVSKTYITVLDWVDTIWSALILASILMYFVIQAFKIPSGSMRTTLIEGDHLFVNKFIYGFRIPLSDGKRVLPLRKVHRKDIVIFDCPKQALSISERASGIKKDFIKRCIGLPGDTIYIINKKVYVNGELQAEPYVRNDDPMIIPAPIKLFQNKTEYQQSWEQGSFTNLPIRDNFGPIKIPENHYFVLGDNRDHSFDSRFWGPLPDKLLKGQALILYWPITRIKLIR